MGLVLQFAKHGFRDDNLCIHQKQMPQHAKLNQMATSHIKNLTRSRSVGAYAAA
jgi:hypothetical protein